MAKLVNKYKSNVFFLNEEKGNSIVVTTLRLG
jgi:hypothetical protein